MPPPHDLKKAALQGKLQPPGNMGHGESFQFETHESAIGAGVLAAHTKIDGNRKAIFLADRTDGITQVEITQDSGIEALFTTGLSGCTVAAYLNKDTGSLFVAHANYGVNPTQEFTFDPPGNYDRDEEGKIIFYLALDDDERELQPDEGESCYVKNNGVTVQVQCLTRIESPLPDNPIDQTKIDNKLASIFPADKFHQLPS